MRWYESITPGRIATKLHPDAHCSRSCSVRCSPPQNTGSIGMSHAASAAKMSGRSWIVVSPLRQCSTRSRSGPMKCGGKHDAQLAIDLREDHVEVDRRVLLRHHDDDDVFDLRLREEQRRELVDRGGTRAFAEADDDEILAERMDVAAFERVVHPTLDAPSYRIPALRSIGWWMNSAFMMIASVQRIA